MTNTTFLGIDGWGVRIHPIHMLITWLVQSDYFSPNRKSKWPPNEKPLVGSWSLIYCSYTRYIEYIDMKDVGNRSTFQAFFTPPSYPTCWRATRYIKRDGVSPTKECCVLKIGGSNRPLQTSTTRPASHGPDVTPSLNPDSLQRTASGGETDEKKRPHLQGTICNISHQPTKRGSSEKSSTQTCVWARIC